MSARTHTPPHPATTGGVDIRLPWWALVLPTLGFVVLLSLMLNPADTHTSGADVAITHFVERVKDLVA